jgi:hypothetical protein
MMLITSSISERLLLDHRGDHDAAEALPIAPASNGLDVVHELGVGLPARSPP